MFLKKLRSLENNRKPNYQVNNEKIQNLKTMCALKTVFGSEDFNITLLLNN